MWTTADSIHWMHRALKLAMRAETLGEVPVGACAVFEGRCVGEGWNQPIGACDPTAHAEVIALRAAARTLGNYRLPHVTLVVTLEPCLMCLGALQHARVDRVVYGAHDPKQGVLSQASPQMMTSAFEVESGVLAAESADLLKRFFEARR
jgi:tRNA(adenine34) deaminase